MTRETALAELRELAEEARHESAESHREAMNSYGAGYDAGLFAGLQRAIEVLLEDEP